MEQFSRWNEMIKDGVNLIIPFDNIINTSITAIACIESLSKRSWIDV